MNQYKNISSQSLFIPGIGEVAAGAVIQSTEPINNANFAAVETAEPETKINENLEE